MAEKTPEPGNPWLMAIGVLLIVFMVVMSCSDKPPMHDPTPIPTVTRSPR